MRGAKEIFVMGIKNMILTKGLTFEYIRRDEEGNVEGINTALDDVSIDIQKGQFIAILGHNGSGKSTFARHLNALIMPTSGEVWVDGNLTSDHDKIWDIRQSAGMVFQNPDNQIIGSIVEEDVGFGPENLGLPTNDIWKRVEEALKSVGMVKYAKFSPNRLSGGQKQRVAIAGTLAMKPECIILDEPTAMLDPNGRNEVIDAITMLNKEENVTIILITHYLEEIKNADHVFVMNEGKVVMEGTPRQIYSKGNDLKNYKLMLPQVAILANRLRQAGYIKDEIAMDENELADIICKYMNR